MSNNKPGQRKSTSDDRVQNEDIEDEMNAGADEDQDEMSAGAEAGAENEEDQNGRAQRSASRHDGSQGGHGQKREGFEARGGRNTREH